MRKISPTDVRNDFRTQLANLTTFHNIGLAGFASESDQSTLTEHSLLAAAVAWEGFISEMFVAYINRDPTQFKQSLSDAVESHLTNASIAKRAYARFGALSIPKHLSKADVLALADSIGNNITFPNFDELQDKAEKWLVTAHAEKKFTRLSAQQKAIVNSVIALRNYIAHRSIRSLHAMNDALEKGALHQTGIRRGANRFHNVGAWLKSTPIGRTETQLTTIIRMLDGIGATF